MKLYEFADTHSLQLDLARYPMGKVRFSVKFVGATIKAGKHSISFSGTGKSAAEAMKDYVEGIRGKVLVIPSLDWKEIKVPSNLVF